MRIVDQIVVVALVVGGLSMWTGCFKSSTLEASSESSSNSSTSSSESSSSSSGGDDEETAYERDVRDVTARFAASGGTVQALRRQLSRVAERHGITDWEHDEETYVGIGRGLARARVRGAAFERLSTELALADPHHLASIRVGYEGSRRQ